MAGVRQGGEFASGPGRFLPAPLTEVLLDRRWCGTTQVSLTGACDPGGLLTNLPSWCALPLIVEAEVVGALLLGSTLPAALDEAVLHRVRALAFSASAALQRAQRHEQVRLYADLLETVIQVHQKAFAGEPPWEFDEALGFEPLINTLCMGLPVAAEEKLEMLGMDSVLERARRARERMEEHLLHAERGEARGGERN